MSNFYPGDSKEPIVRQGGCVGIDGSGFTSSTGDRATHNGAPLYLTGSGHAKS